MNVYIYIYIYDHLFDDKLQNRFNKHLQENNGFPIFYSALLKVWHEIWNIHGIAAQKGF